MYANPTAVIIVLLPFLGLSQAENIKGVLPLNSGTFDKVCNLSFYLLITDLCITAIVKTCNL